MFVVYLNRFIIATKTTHDQIVVVILKFPINVSTSFHLICLNALKVASHTLVLIKNVNQSFEYVSGSILLGFIRCAHTINVCGQTWQCVFYWSIPITS